MLTAVAFLFALSASTTIFIHLNDLMATSRFPPGVGAALHYKALAYGWASANLPPQEAILHSFISFTAQVFNLDLLSAIKLTSIVIFSVLPLSTYLLASVVAENRIVGVASAWLMAFMPVAIAPIMIGNCGLVLGLLFFVVYLTLLLEYHKNGSNRLLLLVLLAETLTVLSDINSALLVLPVIIVFSFFTLQRKEDATIRKLLILSFLFLAIPFSALSALGYPLQVQDMTLWINPTLWTKDLWFTLPLAISTAVGIYTLFKNIESASFSVLLVSALVPLASALALFSSSLHVLSAPILAMLAASPLLWLRESYLVRETKENEENPVVEITIDLPKFAAILLVAILTVSTVNVGYNISVMTYTQYSVSRYFTYEEVASAVEWIDENIPEESILSSRQEAAAWLEALSGKRFIGSKGQDEALISDTIETTSFRILTPSLLVDEWEPFSVSKAPRISYYDGEEYRPIAYIDDSFVRVKLIEHEKEWVESIYRSVYDGHQWLSDSPPEIVLVQHFETPGLSFEKTIEVSTPEPQVRVEYQVNPKPDVELVGLEIPVRIEPWKKVSILATTDNETTLIVDGLEIRISFSGNIISLRHDKYDEGHAMVIAEFNPEGGAIDIDVTLSINSNKRSQMPVWAVHTPDLIMSHGIQYIVAESGTAGFLDRSFADPIESLVVKDSFNRILSESGGNSWVEAPSNAEVLFDESSLDGVRRIGYETGGLYINKTLCESSRAIDILYAIAPIENRPSLVSMNLSIWIDWDILLLDHTIQENEVKLELSSGEFEVEFLGDLMHMEVGPDPTWGQNRVQAVLRLESGGDEVGMTIRSLKPLSFEYEATTRPIMEADDQLTIGVDPNIFTVVFKQGALVICRTNC